MLNQWPMWNMYTLFMYNVHCRLHVSLHVHTCTFGCVHVCVHEAMARMFTTYRVCTLVVLSLYLQ